MTRILFSGDGSSGDLLPMVLMAREFKRAGYDVCVCGSSEQAKMARDFAVPFAAYPHSYSEMYLERQRTGYIHSIRENIRHQEALYQGEYDLLSKIGGDFDVLINFLAELFVPSIAEAFKMPNLKLFTFPMVVSERYAPPTGLPFISENPVINKLHWKAAAFAARHVFSYTRTLNRLRAQLGLPPIGDLIASTSRFDHLMIGLYEELIPACPSWRAFDYTYIGPCLPRTPVRLSDELEAFLAKGAKPIYVGFGSMHHADGDRLTSILLDAARDAGVRVVLAQNNSRIGAGVRGSDDVFVLRDYPIPHHVLFPRLKAAVHHGSWISTHLAAQAGIPQLALPQASDQYLWANVIWKNELGPGGVDMNRMKPRKLSAAIERMTHEPAYETSARGLAQRVRGIDGAANAVELFGRLESRLLGKHAVSVSGYANGTARHASAPDALRLPERPAKRVNGTRPEAARLLDGNAALRTDDGDEVAGEG